jgi:outer membrane protein OmpA-like peptidoglycan-associated protein
VTRLTISIAAIVVAVTLGCAEPEPKVEQRSALNAWLADSVGETAINRAIVLQGTVFAYHFVLNGASLNELGEHDLSVLASHYRENPGALSIRRGNADADLYEARVAAVLDALAQAGVDRSRITTADTLPGGEGITSERLLMILESEREPDSLLPSPQGNRSLQTGVTQ